MNQTARISVVIPAHDAEDTIASAIESVLSQGHPDTEVVVVDDASTDGTAAVVSRLAEARAEPGGGSRLRFLRQNTNHGVSAARNRGLRESTGEIVIFLDADDVHRPGFLDTAAASLIGEVDAVVLGRTVVSGGERSDLHAEAIGTLSGPRAAAATMQDRITPFPWDKAFRREVLGTDPFPEGIARFEDLAAVIVALSRARSVLVREEPLIEYRVTGSSLTWGRVPERSERDASLEFVETRMFAEGRPADPRDLSVLRTLLTVLIAQSAALHLARDPAQSSTIRACRRDLFLRDLLRCLQLSPTAGSAGIMLRYLPWLFVRLVARRTRRRYGATVSKGRD